MRIDETRTRLEVAAERGLTPFTGRDRELRLLHECFAQVQAGHGQAVFLVGEAGLGKSRLLLEFRQQLGTKATWLEGHAMSFGRSFAFHPIIDLLRRNFRIGDRYILARPLDEVAEASKKTLQHAAVIGREFTHRLLDRLAEQYEVLAYHFARGEQWAKALAYFCQAAEKAMQAFANREAVALYDQALEAAVHLGQAVDVQTVMAIHQARANLYFVLSDFKSARAEGERLLVLAQKAEDRGREAIVLAGMGMASTFGHDFDRGLAEAHQAITIAREIEATPVLAGGYFTTGFIHAVTDRLDTAREEIDRAITVSRSGGDVVHQSFALTFAGRLKNWRGEYAEALPIRIKLRLSSWSRCCE